MITPRLPANSASPMTATITHHALTRAFRLSIAACGRSGASLSLRVQPSTEAKTSTPKIAPVSSSVRS
jgi:hypothetical protein